ncbi:MAG: preprotein translocase subunit SecG [Geobacteraceae bacterium]|nr:preprotein translocase subunit SecG [Geobacteraceae bacterium]
MFGFLITIHILVSVALIVIVLLQAGKGADLGATFGTGASQSLFGAGGGSTFLGKMTATAAVIFMLTSLSLAYLSGKSGSSSVMPSKKPVAQTTPKVDKPAPTEPTAAPVAPQQSPKK